MSSTHADNRPDFECLECGKQIIPVAYRAACPDCGGRLASPPDPD
ncbi:rubrerythrin-like domain-containing protein [Halorubrum vacuolatum]|nr:rubrerythrin-like domain-containing protein [Halorubrum vacuolatum]